MLGPIITSSDKLDALSTREMYSLFGTFASIVSHAMASGNGATDRDRHRFKKLRACVCLQLGKILYNHVQFRFFFTRVALSLALFVLI